MNDVVYAENSYGNMNEILNTLGVSSSNKNGYNQKIGISLNSRSILNISDTQHLLVDDTDSNTQEKLDMLFFDFNQAVDEQVKQVFHKEAVVLSQNIETMKISKRFDNTLGVCEVNFKGGYGDGFNNNYYDKNFLDPTGIASSIFLDDPNHKGVDEFPFDSAQVRIILRPSHGSVYLDDSTKGMYIYKPVDGYVGSDKLSFEVSVSGKKIKVVYYIKSLGELGKVGPALLEHEKCPQPRVWNISLISDDALVFSSYAGDSTSTVGYARLPADFARYDYLPPTITFRDLTGAAVGETVGEGANATITLDTDAAGHGWYWSGVRGQASGVSNPLTPWYEQGLFDMDNWLPTSNPNEWMAKAGTDAAGKMDMLSVLLHEYGHALGIEHSSDSHDYMGTTLTPGMRRLPNADEMQLMAQLAGEAREAILAGDGFTLVANGNNAPLPSPLPQGARGLDEGQDAPALPSNLPINMGFGISFLGLLRRNGGASSLVANAAPQQCAIAANTTLTNGSFASNTTSAWETTVKVNANNGAAVLSEVSTSQTRLNQVFVVGADDRYISFTLSNIGLEDVSNGPDDAFEVALLNANTGASLTGNIGLTRTDALLNIQANGNELKATGVTSVVNADGSRTYVVDLV